jgi:hypothetical protein
VVARPVHFFTARQRVDSLDCMAWRLLSKGAGGRTGFCRRPPIREARTTNRISSGIRPPRTTGVAELIDSESLVGGTRMTVSDLTIARRRSDEEKPLPCPCLER